MEHIQLKLDNTSGHALLESTIAQTFEECFEVWKEKQRKYGPDNIAQLGRSGVLDRMFSDKYQRLRRFIYGDAEDVGEGEEDAWLDLVNYAAMGLMLYRNQWPGARRERVTLGQLIHFTKLFIGGLLWSR